MSRYAFFATGWPLPGAGSHRASCNGGLPGVDWAWLALLVGVLPGGGVSWLWLMVSRGTVLRWHRDLLGRRWARGSRRRRPGRVPTCRRVKELVLRLARENPVWG